MELGGRHKAPTTKGTKVHKGKPYERALLKYRIAGRLSRIFFLMRIPKRAFT